MDSGIAFPLQASRIAVDAAFDNFDEFFEHYYHWLEEGSHPFTVQKSHCFDNPRIKYMRVKYACVHRGTPTYRGQGKRPNQTYLGLNCPASLNMKYDKTRDKIVVKAINDQHNHEIGPEIYQTYRQNRRLTTAEVSKVKEMIDANATAELVAKAISQISGKVVSKKDVYNLQNRMKATEEEKKPSRRHYRDVVPARTVALFPDVEFEDEVTISSEAQSDSEETGVQKNKSRKRKTAEDSAMQSLLESTLADVAGAKSDLLSIPGLPNLVNSDAEPIEDFSEVTISCSSIAPPVASTLKRIRAAPVMCVNPLGTRLNLIRLHEEGSTDVKVFGVGDLTITTRDETPGSTVKPTTCIKPGQKVFIKTGAGAAAISRAAVPSFEMPKVTFKKAKSKASKKSTDKTKSADLAEALITGLLRVAPARQLNLLAQVCRAWKEQVTVTLAQREHPIWMMEHLIFSKDTKIEDLLPQLEDNLRRVQFEPRFVLSFVSASLFRPQFGPCDRRINSISAFKELLPKRSVLCEIYGVGVIGSSLKPALGRMEITQAQECNLVGGVSALLMPNMRHLMPVCLVLDGKRLKEIEVSEVVPSYIEQSLGPNRPPLKTLLLFEHGAPSPVAVKKFYDYLLDTHPAGFACSGVEVCQSKVDAAIYTAEHQWGPTVVAIGFLGDCVVSNSLFLTAAECADRKLMTDSLTEWRKRLDKSTFAKPVDYTLDHFCLAFYSDRDRNGQVMQSESDPNSVFASLFPQVPLLGIQANGGVYGHTMDVAHVTDDVHKAARLVLQRRAEFACSFCIVSLPKVH